MHPLLQDFAQGFSPPLVVTFFVAGLGYGLVTAPSSAAPGTDPGAPTGSPTPGGGSTGPAGATPSASPDEIRGLLAQGELRRARDLARAAGLAELHEQANLYVSLTSTIREGAFAKAKTFLVSPDDLGAVRQETDEAYWIEPMHGGEVAVPKDDAGRVVARDEAIALLQERLRAAQREADNGLAVHRQAFLAFRAGLRGLGVELLEAALRSKEGPILVDMFAGGGELARLHQARDRLAGEAGAPPPPPIPTPTPAQPDEPAQPAPTPVVTPAPSADPLDQDPAWTRAEASYREGLELYRGAFSASVEAGAPAVRASLQKFRAAQDLLDPLLEAGWDAAAQQRIERRYMELNSLVLDCTKRLGTGD